MTLQVNLSFHSFSFIHWTIDRTGTMATSTKSPPRRKKADAKSKDAPSGGNFLTRLLFRPRFLLFLALAVSGVVFYPRVKQLLPDLSGRGEYRLEVANITVTPAPRWVSKELVAQTVAQLGRGENLSLLDETLVDDLAAAFGRHPWVEKVSRVRLTATGVDVDLTYRKPVAMVQLKQGLYPIDVRGVLLPPEDFSPADVKHFPIISNIKSTPQGPAGTAWGDETIVGAAQLAETVGPHWQEFNLEAIVAPERTNANMSVDDMIYEFATTGGSRIVWGRAPGVDHPGELTEEQKIGRLQEYVAKYGRFDQAHGPYRIEIHHWREISRRPLSAQKPAQQTVR